ncbi:MAG TPA: sigma-70 family RNA polymerase sigma factor [Terriglobia bacterium]|nr:sigma-70 family RNA polymerase sigma factor [Terriglobia bacterium]
MKPLDRPSRTHDEWIALRCQTGEPSAFEDLVALMERPLLYYATKLTGNPETALDVLQDVWMKAFRGIRKLKDPGSLRPWLYRITHGMAVDRIRQYISRERAEEAHLEGFQESADPSFSEDDAATLHEALNELGLKHREVLVLYFLEDFPLAEIAMVVGCSEGTVKSRLHYAKRAMKDILLGGGYGTKR